MPSAMGRVEGTREDILTLLRRRERMSVDELASEIGLAGATVRRHLDVLQRDGYVSVTQVRGGTGRPRHLFSLTEAGADLFPRHYVRLTQRLLGEIVALEEDVIAGRSGVEIADLVFENMAQRIAREYRSRIHGETLEARARNAAALIADEGIDFEVIEGEPGRLQILGRACPCMRIAEAAGEQVARPCDHDRTMLEALLDVPVRVLERHEVPYDFRCGYELQVAAASATDREQTDVAGAQPGHVS